MAENNNTTIFQRLTSVFSGGSPTDTPSVTVTDSTAQSPYSPRGTKPNMKEKSLSSGNRAFWRNNGEKPITTSPTTALSD